MKRIIFCYILCFFKVFPNEEQLSNLKHYYNEGKNYTESLIKNSNSDTSIEVREFLNQLKETNPIHEIPENLLTSLAKKKCQFDVPEIEEKLEQLFVFLSFSVPDQVWITLSKEIATYGGIIVLRGLPRNSFSELSRQIQKLNKIGVSASIQINPQLFEKFDIGVVPSFVIAKAEKFDKIAGNISLTYALESLVKEGETEIASEFLTRGYE